MGSKFIEVPDFGEIEFPDTMSDEEIHTIISQELAKARPGEEAQTPTSDRGDRVITLSAPPEESYDPSEEISLEDEAQFKMEHEAKVSGQSPEEYKTEMQEGVATQPTFGEAGTEVKTSVLHGAKAFVNTGTLGLPKYVVEKLGYDWPEAETEAERIGESVGSLGGLMAGPAKVTSALKVLGARMIGKLAPKAKGLLTTRASDGVIAGTVRKIADETITMATLLPASKIGEIIAAAEDDVEGNAWQIVKESTVGGAVVGATFGLAKGVVPGGWKTFKDMRGDLGNMKAWASAITKGAGVSVLLDAAHNQHPLDEREFSQKVFEYGLNFLFTLTGGRAPSPSKKGVPKKLDDPSFSMDMKIVDKLEEKGGNPTEAISKTIDETNQTGGVKWELEAEIAKETKPPPPEKDVDVFDVAPDGTVKRRQLEIPKLETPKETEAEVLEGKEPIKEPKVESPKIKEPEVEKVNAINKEEFGKLAATNPKEAISHVKEGIAEGKTKEFEEDVTRNAIVAESRNVKEDFKNDVISKEEMNSKLENFAKTEALLRKEFQPEVKPLKKEAEQLKEPKKIIEEPEKVKVEKSPLKGGATLFGGLPVSEMGKFVSKESKRVLPAAMLSMEYDEDSPVGLSFNPATFAVIYGGIKGVHYKLPGGKTVGATAWDTLGKGYTDKARKPGLIPMLMRGFHKTGAADERTAMEMKDLRRGASADVTKIKETTRQLAAKFSVKEREQMSDLIEKEGNIHNARKAVVEQAEVINKWTEEIGKKLVNVGMVDHKSFSKLKGKYLHRVYSPKASQIPKAVIRGMRNFASGKMSYARRRGLEKKLKVNEGNKNLRGGDAVTRVYNGKSTRYVDLPTAQGLAEKGWTIDTRGQWTVRKVSGNNIRIGRDWTKTERVDMGENRDIAVRFATFMQEAVGDWRLGEVYMKIARDPKRASSTKVEGWLKIPTTRIEADGPFVYGELAGKWVPREVSTAIKGTREPWKYTSNESWNSFFAGYKKALNAWKYGKVVLNPTVHYNNFMSNIGMTVAAGRNPVTILRDGIRAYRNKAERDKAKSNGLLGTDMVAGEMELQRILNGVKGIEKKTGMERLKWVLDSFSNIYQAGDGIYKLGLYKQARAEGKPESEAIDEAHKYYFDYTDLPVGAKAVRDFYIPFFSYTYKSLPTLVEAMAKNPEGIALIMGFLSVINKASYAYLYGADAEKRETLEREVLPDYMQGRTFFGPKNVRTPSNPNEGKDASFLHVGRNLPGGNPFDTKKPGTEGIGWPDILGGSPFGNNPIATMVSSLAITGKNYFGQSIYPYPDDPGHIENVKAAVSHIAHDLIPNNLVIPGSWSFDKVGNALTAAGVIPSKIADTMGWTGVDYAGRIMSPGKAIISTFGVKFRDVDIKEGVAKKARKIKSEMSKARRRLNRAVKDPRMSESAIKGEQKLYSNRIKELTERLDSLMEKAQSK